MSSIFGQIFLTGFGVICPWASKTIDVTSFSWLQLIGCLVTCRKWWHALYHFSQIGLRSWIAHEHLKCPHIFIMTLRWAIVDLCLLLVLRAEFCFHCVSSWSLLKALYSLTSCTYYKIKLFLCTNQSTSVKLKSAVIIISYELLLEPFYTWAATWENRIFAYAKTKTQISFAVKPRSWSAPLFSLYG